MSDHRFLELPALLNPGDLVVVNKTRVRAARLRGERVDTGGMVELLLLERLGADEWEVLARPARRLRPGVVVAFPGLTATVVSPSSRGRLRVVLEPEQGGDIEAAIARSGEMPLPPYFVGKLDDPERYQTIFASSLGSAAAPTAGLHFTNTVLQGLRQRKVGVAAVDLHVSLDTFRPMTVEDVEDHHMHSEWCAVPEATVAAIAEVRQRAGRVIAIGTTVVRTLESYADGSGGVEPGEGRTKLFLKPGSEFTVVDAMVTNFHLPGSTLLVLLAGFIGDSWRHVYETALERGYRFLSFGDAMLAVRHHF